MAKDKSPSLLQTELPGPCLLTTVACLPVLLLHRMPRESAPSLLTELPEPCLLAVLQCCAADGPRSLFSAARAHSRLHQAAVAALHSITAVVTRPEQVDGVLLYLGKHGRHVDSLCLTGEAGYMEPGLKIHQLPPNLQLSRLQLCDLGVQLQPGSGFRGVLGAAAGVAALKQLCLKDCKLLDRGDGLAAALLLLPAGLEHLSISGMHDSGEMMRVPTAALQRLQQLTYLELAFMQLQGPDDASPVLQPLQALTRLADLRLPFMADGNVRVTASMLSSTHHLTRLHLTACSIEPAVLAGKSQLQHLHLVLCSIPGGAAGEAQLLSHLQPLQQLTHLGLGWSLRAAEEGTPPAAAYSAMTASSKLQHLSISSSTLPAGVWQHLLPAGRQLPHLTSLAISDVKQPSGSNAPAPEGSRLSSCCPSLRSLDMQRLEYSAELLAQLQGLSGLHTLRLGTDDDTAAEGIEEVCQLTGLRELSVKLPTSAQEGLLLQLTQLEQLTRLNYEGPSDGACVQVNSILGEAPGDEPVWRQLLRLHLDHSNPAVAQQAAAALAD